MFRPRLVDINLSVKDFALTRQACQCFYQFPRKKIKNKDQRTNYDNYVIYRIYCIICHRYIKTLIRIASIHRQSSNTLRRLFDLRNWWNGAVLSVTQHTNTHQTYQQSIFIMQELVSIPTKSRDWKGIFISLVVIASVMGMIQATIELATPPPGPPRLKTRRMELRQLEEKLFVPNSLNASWVTGRRGNS